MTIRLLYFAWVREQIGLSEEDVALEEPVALTDLIISLRARSDGHEEALGDLGRLRVALNQEFINWDHRAKPGDEVAIFPPVTGG